MLGLTAVVALCIALLAVHAQNNPSCVTSCISNEAQNLGCSSSDWRCMCTVASFQTSVDRCFTSTCSNDDVQIGESFVDTQCSGETSSSISPPFAPSTSTSLTVTNSETSPPQSGRSSHTTASGAPPTPPPGTSPATPTPTPTLGMSSSPLKSSPLTSLAVGTAATAKASSLTNPILSGNPTVASGTIQSLPPATGTTKNGAGRVDMHNQALFGALFGLFGVWFL